MNKKIKLSEYGKRRSKHNTEKLIEKITND